MDKKQRLHILGNLICKICKIDAILWKKFSSQIFSSIVHLCCSKEYLKLQNLENIDMNFYSVIEF